MDGESIVQTTALNFFKDLIVPQRVVHRWYSPEFKEARDPPGAGLRDEALGK